MTSPPAEPTSPDLQESVIGGAVRESSNPRKTVSSHDIALGSDATAPSVLSARFAQPRDAELLAEIAALVNIHNYAQFDRGFLFYSLPEAEYRARIERGDVCYLLECDGTPIGFIVGVPSDRVRSELKNSEEPNHVFRIIEEYAKKHAIESYLFVDQAAILPEYQNRGFGERHFENLASRLSGPYFCDILEAPLRNPRVRYWVKRGFRKIGEVVEQPPERFLRAESSFSLADELTWGIYFLENGGWKATRG